MTTCTIKLAPCTECGSKMLIGQSGLVCSQCPAKLLPRSTDELAELRREHPKRAIIVDAPEPPEAEEETVCEWCLGKGVLECEQCGGTGVDECVECGHETKCEACGGKGTVPCAECSEDEEDWDDDDEEEG